jgi:hypothetical protein
MKTTYELQWREYRKRRNTFFIILATYFPGVLLFALLLQRLLRSDTATSIVAFAWILAFGVAAVRVSTWPCPRCGKCFHAKWPAGNPLTGRCLHCGLPKWADRDTRKPDELPSDQFHCFQCGNVISKGDSTCAKCGWSWKNSGVQQAGEGERE